MSLETIDSPDGRDVIRDIVASERSLLIERSGKYRLVTAPMWVYSRVSGNGLALESAYFFTRHIDDVVDGDREVPGGEDSLAYVHRLIDAIKGNHDNPPDIMKLYDYVLEHTVLRLPGDDLKRDFLGVIETIRQDKIRMMIFSTTGRPPIRNQKQLENYYDSVFKPTYNIGLMIAGSDRRGADIPELAQIQGHLYSLTDLKQDVERGILNVPEEVLDEADVSPGAISYTDLISNEVVCQWICDTADHYGEKLEELMSDVQAMGDRQLSALVKLLGTGLQRRPKQLRDLYFPKTKARQ